jgi:hypothetical protein
MLACSTEVAEAEQWAIKELHAARLSCECSSAVWQPACDASIANAVHAPHLCYLQQHKHRHSMKTRSPAQPGV